MEEVTLQEVLRYYFRKIYIVGVMIILFCLIGIWYVMSYYIPEYKESTTIILSNTMENVELSYSTITLYDSLLTNYVELLKSKALVDRVISSLELSYSVEGLSAMSSFEVIDSSQILRITVYNEDDELAALIANEYVIQLKQNIISVYGFDNISVIDEARVSGEVKTSPVKIIVGLGLFGFIGGSLVVILKYIFGDKARFWERENSRVDTRVFGKYVFKKFSKTKGLQLLVNDLDSWEYEKISRIRNKLLKKIQDTDIKTIAVTGDVMGMSKGYLMLNLANSLSNIGKKVLIMDANIRNGSFSDNCDSVSWGMMEVLAKKIEWSKVVLRIQPTMLDFIGVGEKEKFDSGLFLAPGLEEVLNELKQEYDVILVDIPSYLKYSESMVVTEMMDAMIIVDKIRHLKVDSSRNLEVVGQDGKKILGVIYEEVKVWKRITTVPVDLIKKAKVEKAKTTKVSRK